MSSQADQFESSLLHTVAYLSSRFTELQNLPVLPAQAERDDALLALPTELPDKGRGTEGAVGYLLEEVVKGMHIGHAGPRNYGFVCGGVSPASQLADMLVGSLDENVQVTLPQATISTYLETLTTHLVLDLLSIPRSTFLGSTITTGATASNILGLTCARDALLLNSPHLPPNYSISESGFPHLPSGPAIQVLAVKPHGSMLKAAAVTGIGRLNVVDCSVVGEQAGPFGLGFDLGEVERRLKDAKQRGAGVVVIAGIGEVNTGASTPEIPRLRELCDQYGGWLHIDAAFGGFGALVKELEGLSGDMAMGDSLTLDGHKWLQAPYDTALFYTRSSTALYRSFGPSPLLGAPAYLTPPPALSSPPASQGQRTPEDQARLLQLQGKHAGIESPLNCGIENSRRFRGLPLFAGLVENGREGYTEIVNRNVAFANDLAHWLLSPLPTGGAQHFTLLNALPTPTATRIIPLNIVLFRGSPTSPFPPSDPTAAVRLVKAINDTGEIYVSATSWEGVGAVRVAVSNWRTGEQEGVVLRRILKGVMEGSV